MTTQKQAVTNAVLSVVPNYELGGETILMDVLTDNHKSEIKSILFEGFRAGEINLSEEAQAKFLHDDKELTKYISGLMNNWFRKNKEFNNGNAYQPDPAKVGTRSGAKDPQIKALRALKKKAGLTAQQVNDIDEAIKARLAEIKPETVVEINVDDLPAEFRNLVD